MKKGFWLSTLLGSIQAHSGFPTLAPSIPRGGASPKPRVDLPEQWAPGPHRALVFMDKFCDYHGGYTSRVARDVHGVACINILSDYMMGFFETFHPHLEEPKSMGIPTQEQLQGWLDALPTDLLIEGIVCESDSGLADSERVAALLKIVKQNGHNEARRNKFLMNEAVSQFGLATVKQKLCRSVEEAKAFATDLGLQESPQSGDEEQPSSSNSGQQDEPTGLLGTGRNTQMVNSRLCIVKPIRGVASEQVFLCQDLPSVERAFNEIHGSTIFGSPRQSHDTVLVQEFAHGTEYAIDMVSKDGEHKVAALWRYDKRPANGASFVYHATELIEANDSQVGRNVCAYAMQALDALGVKWGTTHTEVIMTSHGPRLVEVNCRQHNMDFAPLTMACMGYNSLDMVLDAYLGDGGRVEKEMSWDDYPTLPSIRAHAAMVHLVNYSKGKLSGVNGEALNEIQSLDSVMEMEVYPSFLEMGKEIAPTVDIRSDAGWIQLVNDDAQTFQRDYQRILDLMPTLFFTEEP